MDERKVMMQPHIEGLSRDDRVMELANMVSLWEKKPASAILSAERDMLARIVDIADENKSKGLTDAFILLAAEHMIQDEFHEAQFHLEALMPDHREELVKRALAMKEERE